MLLRNNKKVFLSKNVQYGEGGSENFSDGNLYGQH